MPARETWESPVNPKLRYSRAHSLYSEIAIFCRSTEDNHHIHTSWATHTKTQTHELEKNETRSYSWRNVIIIAAKTSISVSDKFLVRNTFCSHTISAFHSYSQTNEDIFNGLILACSDAKLYTTRGHEDLSLRNFVCRLCWLEVVYEREEKLTQLNADFLLTLCVLWRSVRN